MIMGEKAAASERVVTASHLCEDDPEVINEVWRILHVHLEDWKNRMSQMSSETHMSVK